MNLCDAADVIRVYDNGTGGMKFYASSRQARSLGLTIGDLYELRRVAGGLELVPIHVDVQAQDAGEIPVEDMDPFSIVYRSRKTSFCRIPTCPSLGATVHRGPLGARLIAGATPCTKCWISAAHTPTQEEVEIHG